MPNIFTEKRAFIALLRQLRFEQIEELYYMSKGMTFVAKKIKEQKD